MLPDNGNGNSAFSKLKDPIVIGLVVGALGLGGSGGVAFSGRSGASEVMELRLGNVESKVRDQDQYLAANAKALTDLFAKLGTMEQKVENVAEGIRDLKETIKRGRT